ncbi:MAG TPA: SDR family oxidoreductase [Solirubrobacteraceae bacterium]|nr:SDR family oxidoreductase [Solirubrobacteraceae bacterium]
MAGGVAEWNFDERVVVVTDASSSRGSEQVAAFAAAGAKVYACGSLEPVAAAVRGSVEAVAVDFSVESSVTTFAARISTGEGGLDVLVVNDPATHDQSLVEMPDTAWQRLIAASVTGGFLASKHLAPLMFSRRYGKIVFTTGPESSVGLLGRAHVCASRHAIVGLAKDLAIDAATHQVNVNVAAAAREVDGGGNRSAIDALTHAVLWLASDASRFITGSVLSADLQ